MDFLAVIFQVFWTKSRVLGRIGRSGKVLGFISSNFGPNPTAGRPLKGNNRGAIIIIIIPDIRRYRKNMRKTKKNYLKNLICSCLFLCFLIFATVFYFLG